MSYQMEYGLQSIQIRKFRKKKSNTRWLSMTAVILLGAILMHTVGMWLLSTILTPDQVVRDASEQMVRDIQDGSSFYDAVETFYGSISQ